MLSEKRSLRMRRWMIVGLLVLIGQLGWTQSMVLFQGTYMNVGWTNIQSFEGREVTLEQNLSLSTVGLGATVFVGDSFGFLGGIGLTSSEVGTFRQTPKGEDLTDEQEERQTLEAAAGLTGVSLSADLGVGLRFGADTASFLIGGGAHVKATTVVVDLLELGGESWVLGPGVQVTAIIGDTIKFAVSLKASYGLLEIVRIPELQENNEFQGALSWGLAAGIGIPIGGQ